MDFAVTWDYHRKQSPENPTPVYEGTKHGVATPNVQPLIERVSQYLPEDLVDEVRVAYVFAEESHRGQFRKSGEPYIAHPLSAADSLADLRLDAPTIMAALLHDVIEDCGVTFGEIESRFGREVATLVDGVTKLTRMDFTPDVTASNGHKTAGDAEKALSQGDVLWSPDPSAINAESLRKMLVAMAEDIRVVLVKLADRLHNMQTLGALPREKRKRIAQETLEIYSPLAHRLGIWNFKWRLDDLSFRHINPARFREISRMLRSGRREREMYIARVSRMLQDQLEKFETNAEVTGRPKSVYSIHQKTEKYAAQGKEPDEIFDLYALRVLIDAGSDEQSSRKGECYKALGAVHDLWSPMQGGFDDYIGNPKENGYEALHTTVMCEGGHPLEVQIKTLEMHQVAEYGVAAHWRYKEGKSRGDRKDRQFEEKMSGLRQVLEWQREASGTEEFIEGVKQDLFSDQVFVYTPKGDIVQLAAGSTPLDFAYKIHTELGHKCTGGKVNGRLVALNTQLKTGDTVEIVTSKSAREGPSLDWLNPDRGFLQSERARAKVRVWFRRQARESNITRGKELLRRELRRLNLKLDDTEILFLVHNDNMDNFLESLGSGGISEPQLSHRLAQARQLQEREDPFPNKSKNKSPDVSSKVEVAGVGGMLVSMARCCNPIPGDDILGYVTRAKGVSCHKRDCPNLRNRDEPERIIHVSWGSAPQLYPVRILIEAYDRVGLLRDVTTTLSAEKVNIASVFTSENNDGTVNMELTMHTTGLDQLGKLFPKLEGIRNVTEVSRVRSGT